VVHKSGSVRGAGAQAPMPTRPAGGRHNLERIQEDTCTTIPKTTNIFEQSLDFTDLTASAWILQSRSIAASISEMRIISDFNISQSERCIES